MSGITLTFYILSALIVLSAIGVISFRNPVHSALSLVATLFFVAGIYLTLNAEFLAVIQVLTYAGAILVLFIFIIMLLNLQEDELREKRSSWWMRGFVILLTGTTVTLLLGKLCHWPAAPTAVAAPSNSLFEQALQRKPQFASFKDIGMSLFTDYVVLFEIAGVLLTIALIGAVLLAKKDLKEE